MDDFDAMLKATGGFSYYQWMLFAFNQLSMITSSANWILMALAAYTNQKKCFSNGTSSENFTLPNLNATGCNSETYFRSIVDEWHLDVPERKSIPSIILTAQMAGTFFGALVGGQLSDSYGRRSTLLGFSLVLHFIGAVSPFSSGWQTFLVFRVIIGFTCGAVTLIQYVHFIEMIPAKWRQISYFAGGPLTFVVLGVVGYLTRDWRHLSLAINGIWLIPGVMLIFFVVESPKWLLQQGRFGEAKSAFNFIARWNGKRARKGKEFDSVWQDVVFHAQVKIITSNSEWIKRSYHHLFTSGRKLAMHAIVLILAHLALSCVGWGIVFNVGALSGDPCINVILVGLVRWPMSALAATLDRKFHWFGRRLVTQAGFVGTSACLVAMIIFQISDPRTNTIPYTACALLASGFTVLVWLGTGLYMQELFPTALRTMGNALCSSGSRVGNVLSATLPLLEHVWLPLGNVVMLGMICLIGLACFFLLPESKGRPLPDLAPAVKTEAANGNQIETVSGKVGKRDVSCRNGYENGRGAMELSVASDLRNPDAPFK